MNTTPSHSRKDRALALLRANRIDEAKALCEEVARTEDNAGAWCLLSIIHGRLGNPGEAERCARAALRVRPDYMDAYVNLGTALRLQNRAGEAIASLRYATRLKSDHAEAHYQLGLALAADQRLDEAIASLREATRLAQGHTEAWLHLGIALAATGQRTSAITAFHEGISRQPAHPVAHALLGNVLVEHGEMKQAVEAYRRALAITPNNADIHNNLGNALVELGQPDEAIAAYRRALESNPGFLGAYHNLGHVLLDQGRAAEAVEVHRVALRTAPDHASVLADLGVALASHGNDIEAIACYRRALAIQPDDAETHYNLGNSLRTMGQLDQAIRHYGTSLRLQPADADTHMNLALSYLALGRFHDGWREYDWQWRREGASTRPFPPTAWNGADLRGRAVLLHSEQGIGDELFFLRFVPWLKKQGAGKIVYSPSAKIRSLLSRWKTLDQLALPDEWPTDTEFVFSVGDLPRLLGMVRVDQIPAPIRLSPLTNLITAVQQRLSHCGPPPYVGVTWRGGTTKKNALYKEVPLEKLAACLRNTGTSVVILQRNPEAGEIDAFVRTLGRPAHDFSALNENLEEMLALLSLLDGYVGVSNANMHLRAAVGKTAKVLVPRPPEWRWMADGRESPWFPGFTVYRQGYDGSWETAFSELAVDLKKSFS